MGGMHSTTAYNHLERLSRVQADILMRHRSAASTHDAILAEMKARVFDDPARNKLSREYLAILSERFHAGMRELYSPNIGYADLERMLAAARKGEDVKPLAYLRWALRVDGVETTSADICARRAAGDDGIWDRVEGAYVWNHKPDRPFSPWERTAGMGARRLARKGE
jgi:hypothetical protein